MSVNKPGRIEENWGRKKDGEGLMLVMDGREGGGAARMKERAGVGPEGCGRRAKL